MAPDIFDEHGQEREPVLPQIPLLDLRRAIEQEPQPLDFVLPALMAGTVGALVSPGATGKTMLALEMAIAIAGGPDLLGLEQIDPDWKRQIGRVVLLSAEDPAEVLALRLYEMGKRMSPDEREHIYELLTVAPLVGYGVDMMSAHWRHWIAQMTQGARLVVIDTLRRFHQLDENDGGAMAGVLAYLEQLCRENGTTVLFLHHTSKAAGMNAGDAQQASRGSSVLTDNARFQANLIAMSEEQAKKFDVEESCRRSFVRLSWPKVNYSAPMADRWFRRREGGILEPAVLSKQSKPIKAGKPVDRQEADDDRW